MYEKTLQFIKNNNPKFKCLSAYSENSRHPSCHSCYETILNEWLIDYHESFCRNGAIPPTIQNGKIFYYVKCSYSTADNYANRDRATICLFSDKKQQVQLNLFEDKDE